MSADQRIAKIAMIPPQQARIGLAGDPGLPKIAEIEKTTTESRRHGEDQTLLNTEERRERREGLSQWGNEGNAQLSGEPIALVELFCCPFPSYEKDPFGSSYRVAGEDPADFIGGVHLRPSWVFAHTVADL
jgi:hypothetical protein